MTDKLRPYLARIAKVDPDLVLKDVSFNQEGMVNDVVIINQQRVFRFGKQPWSAADLEQEERCLTLARDHIDMPLPVWTRHAADFISYEMLPGVALQPYHIMEANEHNQEALAAQMGTFLRQLHNIPMAAVIASEIAPSVTNRTFARWEKLYADVQQEMFPHLMDYARDWVHHHFAPLVTDPSFMTCTHTFMNGDLGHYHLLYDEKRQRLNGIIDFGTAGTGDPACDIGCLLDQYGEGFIRQMAPHYPGLSSLIERARFWAGTLALQWGLAGLRNPEDPSWHFVHLGRSRGISPIGSGW